jgi:hypothetical protein
VSQPDPTPAWLVSPLSWLALFLLGLVSWFGRREMKRIDEALEESEKAAKAHAERIIALEESRVSRDDLDELRESLTASIINGVERLEKGVDRRHQEHREDREAFRKELRESLDTIHARVDELWSRKS